MYVAAAVIYFHIRINGALLIAAMCQAKYKKKVSEKRGLEDEVKLQSNMDEYNIIILITSFWERK